MTTGTIDDGVAVVMPAFREEHNLTGTVEDMLATLGGMGEQHLVVVVNDGSDDRTGEVADELAARYPGRVHVVHHEVNKGYGAAVRTGIATALEHTDVPWIFLTDSDGQFRGEELPWFVAEARNERADAVIGYRPRRADPMMRKVNAWLWTRASRMLLGVGARDVDCAYKLVGRRVLDGVQLHGDAALISPELLMKIRARDARILQRPVRHYPRVHGEQTGANLRVILISLLGLVRLWFKRMDSALPGRVRRAIFQPSDPVCAGLTLASVVAAVVSYLVFSARHVLLDYPETTRSLLTARGIAEGLGLGKVGSAWLPLWHMLAAVTAWNDTWYYSGFSGSVISMVAYVFATRYLYLTARALSGNRVAGAAAAVVFAADPNVLYLQSTPMHGLLFLACTAAVAYHLLLWTQHGGYRQLAATAIAAMLATITSYTGWVLDLGTALIVCYVAWQRVPELGVAERLRRTEAELAFYALPSLTGIVGWLAWNAGLSGNPLSFISEATGAGFGVPPGGTGILAVLRDLADGAGLAVLVTGLIGLAWYLMEHRLRPETTGPLALVAFAVFTLCANDLSDSPGSAAATVAVVLPAALFTGYLVGAIWQRVRRDVLGYAAVALLTAAVVGLTAAGGIPALREAQAASSSPTGRGDAQAGAWLRAHYSGGLLLMTVAGNETVLFDSHIPLGQVVSEDERAQWQRALADPTAQGIRWIYARRTPGTPDAVWLALNGAGGTSRLVRYTLAYADSDRVIYREWELA
jgi:hypothetical protein